MVPRTNNNPEGSMMADWYPGAWRVDVGGNGNRITARPPENILHIAASSWNVNVNNPTSLEGISGWIEQGSTEAHTYNDKYGNFVQYCSLFLAVDGTKDGNWRNRTHEAWNPPESEGDLNNSGYTPEQCERFSDFLAWDSKENGTLLQNMRDSRVSSHGVGAHRYGITGYNPWKQVGGEVWSLSSSKLCPGTARVNQLDSIIRRAQFIKDHNLGTLPPGRVDLEKALARGGTPPVEKDWFEMATEAQLEAIVRRIVGELLPSPRDNAKAVWDYPIQSQNPTEDGSEPKSYSAQTFLGAVDKHTNNIPEDVWNHKLGPVYTAETVALDNNKRLGGTPIPEETPKA